MGKKKVLIVAAGSVLGGAISKCLQIESDFELLHISSQPFKVPEEVNVNFKQISALDHKDLRKYCLELLPDYIINTAGLSDPVTCEQNKKLAFDLNVSVAENLIRTSVINKTHLITFSTDWIFDGKKGSYVEDDKPNPINYYGKTKHNAENNVLVNLEKYAIIRLGMVYGKSPAGKEDFISRAMIAEATDSEVEYMTGLNRNPTFLEDVAYGVKLIIDKERNGFYNFAGPDIISMSEIVHKVETFLNSKISKRKVINQSDIKLKVPANSGLINLKAETDLGMKFLNLESGMVALRHQLSDNGKYM